jgi:hydrogenase nickel incorporation protein HypA/HybF
MHEMSLMVSMLEIIEDQARQEGFRRVTRVTLEIGQMAGVDPEAMRFAFEAGTLDSVAEGAELIIEETIGRARCPACGLEAPVQVFYEPCAACGQVPQEIIAGRAMRIVSLDVD